jgi:hypothetical protein
MEHVPGTREAPGSIKTKSGETTLCLHKVDIELTLQFMILSYHDFIPKNSKQPKSAMRY